jgi:hypothetical protein
MVSCATRRILCASYTRSYKKTGKRGGTEYLQPTESKTFQSASDNFDTEIRVDKADAPSTMCETQLIFLFRGIQNRSARVILGVAGKNGHSARNTRLGIL